MTAGPAIQPTPIFVLGLQRSGTTWLANVLASHPDIVAAQSEDHFGVHESIYFSHFARAFPDLTSDESFRQYVDAFTTSDYYLLTGLEREWLYRQRPREHASAFRAVMDEMARRSGAQAWVEKTPQHTLLAEDLAAAFPDARFVAIVRKPMPVVASHVGLLAEWPGSRRRRVTQLVRLALACSLHERYLKRFCRTHAGAMLTSYEALGAEPGELAQRISSFVGVEFTPEMLDLPWRRNTSFRAGRRPALTRRDRSTVAATLALLRLVPVRVLRAWTLRRQARREVDWPSWCWRRRDQEALK